MQPVSGHTTCQIPDIENSCSRDSSRKTPPSVGSARFSSPKTRPLPANPRECRRFSHTWKSRSVSIWNRSAGIICKPPSHAPPDDTRRNTQERRDDFRNRAGLKTAIRLSRKDWPFSTNRASLCGPDRAHSLFGILPVTSPLHVRSLPN